LVHELLCDEYSVPSFGCGAPRRFLGSVNQFTKTESNFLSRSLA
jgi:hypothetical protein